MDEKILGCDICDEDWEESFFCEICSKGGHLEMHTEPLLSGLEWDYIGPDCEEREVWVPNGVCFNCCPGHKPQPSIKERT